MKKSALILVVMSGICFFPQYAHADAGTPLMWATALHLFIGNALVGVGEGLLLSWIFSVRKRKSIPVMIVANYASAWFGAWFISSTFVRSLPIDLNNGRMWFWIMVIATYCMTLVLEWPFIAWCFRGAPKWLKKSV